MMEKFRQLRWLWITTLVLLLDWMSKDLANHYLTVKGKVLLPVLSLTLVHNPGAAFGMLSTASGWQTSFFEILASLASILLFVWLLLVKPGCRLMPVGLTLILGGALGNLYDRVVQGSVTDFIDFHYQGWNWPVFNIADSAVTIGVIVLMLGLVRKSV